MAHRAIARYQPPAGRTRQVYFVAGSIHIKNNKPADEITYHYGCNYVDANQQGASAICAKRISCARSAQAQTSVKACAERRITSAETEVMPAKTDPPSIAGAADDASRPPPEARTM